MRLGMCVWGGVVAEGNRKIKDDQLSQEIQSEPRGTLSRPMVQSDALRIAEIYRRSGRDDVHVTPEIIEQPSNRVDLVFTIEEGPKTGVKVIRFVGNNAFSAARLKDIIKTHESDFLSFLGGNDVYAPDRVEADRDLIRRFYLKHGNADVQVVAALTELQMPLWFLPKEVGLKGSAYADAGSLWDYRGPTSWAATGEVNTATCKCGLQFDDRNIVRTSLGVGLIWASPFGPLRFDYAVPLTRGKYDIVQQFKFGRGTSF
jgi:outer membrane protein assembly factor BamA